MSSDRDNYWLKTERSLLARQRSRRQLIKGGAFAGLGALAIATVGCSGSSSKGSTATSTAKGTSSTTAGATSAPGSPRVGGKANVSGWGEGDVLDPVFGQGGFDQAFLWCLFDNLVAYDKDLNPNGSRSLASSWESPDNTTLVFHLRPNIKFTNGDAVDANAVKASLTHAMDKTLKTNSTLGNLGSVSSIETPDSSTVTLHLTAPDFPLLTVLGDRAGMILNMAALTKVGQDAFNRQPIGSGAYTLKEWVQGDHMTMAKNPNYWQAGHPYLDELTWKFIANTSVADEGFLANQLDLIWGPQPKDWDEIAKHAGSFAKSRPGVSLQMFYMNNVDNSPLLNVHARRAFSYALDRDAIVKATLAGHGSVAHGPIAPGNAYAFDPTVGASVQTYDLDKAKSELSAAGLPNGYSVTCTTSTDPVWIQQTTIAKASLSKVGIDLQVTTAPSPAFYQTYFDKKFNILMSGFSGRADPIDTLNYLYAGDGFYGHINIQPQRPDIDALLVKSVATQDPKARAALYNQVVKIAAEDAYDVYMLYPDVLAASNKLNFDIFGDGKPHFGQGDVSFAQ